jgi:tripartite-type tricarboxylate transporter receptor subunit TctC
MRAPHLLLASALAFFGVAHGQRYPAKPIHLVTPFPPAGALDIVGRAIAPRLGAALGQPVVFENRPGAGGVIGSAAVAKAAPDGYTLLLSSASTHSIAPAVNPTLSYDPVKDFAPIVHITRGGASVLIVSKDSPWNTAGELVEWMRAHPGKATYGSGGVGTVPHLNGAALAAWGDLKLVHVPYKGAALVLPDLMAGRVTFMFDSVMTAQSNVLAGNVKALGVSGGKRAAQLPRVRTLAESGLAGFNPSGAYMGMWAPAGTPRAIIERLNYEMNELLHKYDLTAEMAKLGIEPAGGSPEEFSEVVQRDIDAWSRVARKTGVRLD